MKRLTVLTLIAALCLSCTKNHPPVIYSLIADPDYVYPGDTVVLNFTATHGEDQDPWMRFEWSAEAGFLYNPTYPTGSTFYWVAPKEPGGYYITLTLTDPEYQVRDSVMVIVKDTQGTFFDSRDSHEYNWVKIGKQIWMAENLSWLPEVSSSDHGSKDEKHYYVYGNEVENVDSARQNSNYRIYGVLYNWYSAMEGDVESNDVPSGVRGACPRGWHIPSTREWNILFDWLTENGFGYGGSGDDIGKSLAADSLWKDSWHTGQIGSKSRNNKSGFNALPGGGRGPWGGFNGLFEGAYFWSSKASYGLDWLHISFRYNAYKPELGVGLRAGGLSIRCLKDVP